MCTAITCPALSLASGSVTYSNARNFGSVATFACEVGFSLNGAASAACGGTSQTGAWSAATPTCVGV
jgi:hypothetical protein